MRSLGIPVNMELVKFSWITQDSVKMAIVISSYMKISRPFNDGMTQHLLQEEDIGTSCCSHQPQYSHLIKSTWAVYKAYNVEDL